MVKVECDGCKAPYQIDEKRIPPTGLKMRCPKCGTSLLVTKPPAEGAAPQDDLPAVAVRPPPFAAGPTAPIPKPAPIQIPKPAPVVIPKPAAAARPVTADGDRMTMRAGFGEIDLQMDLPSAVVPDDLPAVRVPGPGPMRAPPPNATAPFAPKPPPAPSFDDDDLPAVHGGHSDLPSVRDAGADPYGRAPAVRAPNRANQPAMDRSVERSTMAFGDIDLPMVADDADHVSLLPATSSAPPPPPRVRGRTVNFGDIDLPSIPDPVGSPYAIESVPPDADDDARGFGELDLPLALDDSPGLPAPLDIGLPMTVSADLPAQGRAALPPPEVAAKPKPPKPPPPAKPDARARPPLRADAPEADLPMAAQVGLPDKPRAELPSAVAHGLPMPAQGTGLPMPAQGSALPMTSQSSALPMVAAGAGLPVPTQGSSLPMPAQGSGLPMPAQGFGLPMAAQGSSLPMPAQTSGLPMHAPGGGLPMAAQGQGLPMHVAGGGLPVTAQGQGLPMPVPGGGLPMTADVGLPVYEGGAYDDSDRAVPQGDGGAADLASVGDEADLGADVGLALEGPSHVQPQQRPREPEPQIKKSRARRVGLAAAVLVTLSGGALALVPTIGPFGAYFVADQLNAKAHAAALAELRRSVAEQLEEDTHAAASAAIDRCKAARASMPRYRPAAAYCAFVALERGLRFGRRSDDETLAKQLLLAAGDAGGDSAALANAALDALAAQLPKARSEAAALAQGAPSDVDVAVLEASIESADKAATKTAVATWKHAVELKKSARTLFGLARAQLAAGDEAGAEASARAAFTASPKHAGARTLVAGLIAHDLAREPEALSLLKQVTEDGAISRAASEAERVDAFTQLGRIHLARSRISAAEQAFAAALKISPLAVQALVGDAELLYRSGRYSEALARFETASNAAPQDVAPQVGIAKTWIALERMKEAKDRLKKLRDQNPGEPLVAFWLGRADEALGNKKEAEAAYIEAIKLGGSRPEVVDAYVALSHLLSGVGRSEDANAKLAEATKKFPDLPALHRARGEVALQMGRYEEAKSQLEASLAKEEDLGARFRLGVALRRMRKFPEATAIFEKVASVDPDFPGLALERGLLFEETNQSERALAAYRDALKKAPNDIDLKLRVGSAQVMAGLAGEAEKTLEEVRKVRPNSAEVNHFLGRALLVKGHNLAEAMRYLELAVSIDANRAEYHLYVGWAANELGQPAKAATELNKALELDRELGDAYWQRGVLLQKQGATLDALKDLETAIEKRPSRYEAWATIALSYQDLQRWADAEQAWRRALAGNDNSADWHYRLGKLLASHGSKSASAPELEKALTLADRPDEPQHAWLYDAHFLFAEAMRAAGKKAQAVDHYKRFLELAPRDNAYRAEAEKAIAAAGGR